jgi:NAD(P)-dependent dehydrogenase (short-subunit alcohol dehydrogenase family)
MNVKYERQGCPVYRSKQRDRAGNRRGILGKGRQCCARRTAGGRTGGAIVNVGSINSFLGFPTGSEYVASKHGQIGLTTSVSAELAPKGIRVNLVCPGIIDTPMHHRLRALIGDKMYDDVLQQHVHARRAGRPQTFLFEIGTRGSIMDVHVKAAARKRCVTSWLAIP